MSLAKSVLKMTADRFANLTSSQARAKVRNAKNAPSTYCMSVAVDSHLFVFCFRQNSSGYIYIYIYHRGSLYSVVVYVIPCYCLAN